MNEEFEALEKLGKLHLPENYNYLQVNETEEFNIVRQALTELKKIKSVEPSEALEDLKELHEMAYGEDWEIDEIRMSSHIKQSLLKAIEQEKVLEILKPLCEVVETPVKKFRYLKINGVVVYTFKTEEEFDLLKRWKNEKR